MTPELVISNVWKKVRPEMQAEIVAFWQDNKMLSPEVNASERALQVVLTVRNNGNIVGITSAGSVKYAPLNGNHFYVFRMAVLPAFRVPGIESKLIVETRDSLEAFAKGQSEMKCIGMLTFVENPQLMLKRNEAVWPASKMVYIGNDKLGRHVRVYYFKGSMI